MNGGIVRDEGIELAQARVDQAGRRQMGCDRLGRLEPVPRNAKHRRLIRGNLAARDQLLGAGHGHTARCLGKNAFRFSQQADALNDFLIGGVLA